MDDLACELVANNISVHVITGRNSYENDRQSLPKRDCHRGVQIERIWSTSFGKSRLLGRIIDALSFHVATFLSVLVHTRRGDVVLVATDPPMISVAAAVACGLKRGQLINWCQDIYPEVARALQIKIGGGLFFRMLQLLRNWSLKRATSNVAINDEMASILAGFGVDQTKLAVLHNWADPGIHPVAKSENTLRKNWNLDDGLTIGYSGNFGRAHKIDKVIELIESSMETETIDWVFIGGGDGMDRLRKESNRKDWGGRVQFHPYQKRSELAQSLSAPDVHLVSLDPDCEGLIMPSKLYGALAAGRGILSFGAPDGSVAQIVDENDIGVVLDMNKPASDWIPALMQLASDPAAVQETGARASHLYDALFARKITLDKWVCLVTQISAKATGQPALSALPKSNTH